MADYDLAIIGGGLNGVSIANATNATLTLNNVQPTQSGSYSVVVRNVAAIVPPYEETTGYHGVSAAVEFHRQLHERAVEIQEVRCRTDTGDGI